MRYSKDLLNYSINGIEYNVTNIFKKVDLSELNQNYISTYTLIGESAMEAALKIYGNSEYYWILYVVNNVVNPFSDWYMTEDALKQYCLYKYDDILAPHTFFDSNTKEELSEQVSEDMLYLLENNMPLPLNVSYYTNYEYESVKNEGRKNINIINKNNLIEFVNMYTDALKG